MGREKFDCPVSGGVVALNVPAHFSHPFRMPERGSASGSKSGFSRHNDHPENCWEDDALRVIDVTDLGEPRSKNTRTLKAFLVDQPTLPSTHLTLSG